ncbi:unnamed protein product [Heterobilharzia americana]|nr:unnamed protein product [Heterobilharzia americana]
MQDNEYCCYLYKDSKRSHHGEAELPWKRRGLLIVTRLSFGVTFLNRWTSRISSRTGKPYYVNTEKNITRSKDEALSLINKYKKLIEGGEYTLEELARTESDCGSADSGGDLNFFGRGQMQKAFEDAAFNLKVGEMCGPVYTESGIHLIKRTA